MFRLSIRFVAIETNGKEYLVGRADYPSEIEPGPLTSVVARMVGRQSDGFSLGPPSPIIVEPEHWKASNDRKGQIALAVMKDRMMREGIRLRPNELRSDLGNAAKSINKQNPDLKVTFDEILAMTREIVAEMAETAFRLTPEEIRKAHATDELRRATDDLDS